MMQNALVAWPYSGRGCARSAARPCTWASAASWRIPARDAHRTGGTVRAPRDASSSQSRPRLARTAVGTPAGTRSSSKNVTVVVAGVALGSDEPRARVDGQPLGGQQLAHARVVGHLREGPRIRPAASAAARTAVVGRLVRVVETDRSVSDDEHERRQAIANPDVFEDAADDIRHLPHGEPGILPDGRRCVARDPAAGGSAPAVIDVSLHAAPSGREPREHDAQDQRDQRQPAERRHQHRTAHRQPASQMHVVAEEPGGAPLQTPRASASRRSPSGSISAT